MVFAHIIGKKRLAANVRPTFVEAWGLVVIDMCLVLMALFLALPFIGRFIYANQPSDQSTGFFLAVLYVVFPLAVLINGCFKTSRTRKRYT